MSWTLSTFGTDSTFKNLFAIFLLFFFCKRLFYLTYTFLKVYNGFFVFGIARYCALTNISRLLIYKCIANVLYEKKLSSETLFFTVIPSSLFFALAVQTDTVS